MSTPVSRYLLAAAALACFACGEPVQAPLDPAGTDSDRVTPGNSASAPLIVSEARMAPSGSEEQSASELGVAYVSLPPASLPWAVSVEIRNLTAGGPAVGPIPVINGGFDPVAVPARESDRLLLTFRDDRGLETLLNATIPPRRPPVIVRTDPPKGRTDVALSTRPVVLFSEPIASETVNPFTLRLLLDGVPVPGGAGLVPESPWAAEFTPTEPLEPGADYELLVTRDIRDLNGDPMEAALSVTFQTEAAPEPPPQGRLAFVSTRHGGQLMIYSINVDGSELTALAQGDAPAWSADGQRIAFERYGADGPQIWVMNADGSDQRFVTEGEQPTWSPDGRIAFVFSRPHWPPQGGIFVIDADGSGRKLLLDHGWANVEDWGWGVMYLGRPRWSPDGRRIAFHTINTDAPSSLALMNADGSNPHLVVQYIAGWPVWSPDGSRVAFNSSEDGEPIIASIIVDDGALGQVALPHHPVYPHGYPTLSDWSSDGRYLILDAWHPDRRARSRVFILNAATGEIRRLIPDANDQLYDDYAAVWAPVMR